MKKLIFLPALLLIFQCTEESIKPENPADMPYIIEIDPNDFITAGFTGNEFFPITPNKTFILAGENEDGETVRVEEIHTTDTKEIMGVTCAVINAVEYENGELVENTYDWYAQDNPGNIWYFGELSEEYEKGVLVSTDGSWEAGVDGALPGVIMFADPVPSIWYRQEYYEGEAEDVAQIMSLNETVSVPFGNFTNCLQTAEWTPLEKGVVEHKFYASGIGVVKVITIEGDTGFEELIDIVDN